MKTAHAAMIPAAHELRQASCVATTISADGTWQRRVFSSLNGVVTIIANDTGKCIDCFNKLYRGW